MSVQKKITNVLLTFTCFCIAMEATRMWRSCSLGYIFLLWNLVLAWVPYLLSIKLSELDILTGRGMAGGLLILWVLFLPNGPYIITDLVHLRLREPMPIWYDVMLVSSFAWIGLLLTLLSIRNVHHKLQRHMSPFKVWSGLLLLFLSAGYGIYLGRFLRWNSWEVFYRPFYLLQHAMLELIHPFHHPRPVLVTVIIGILLSFSYAIIYLIGHQSHSNEITRDDFG